MERWLPIPGFPGYQVSESGRIKGLLKELSPTLMPTGHLQVGLRRDGRGVTLGVHKVVCLAFHADTYFPGAYALHKDSIPGNCHESNLYWGTQAQNGRDMVEAGNFKTRNERHGMAKLDWQRVREIRRRYAAGEKQKPLSEEFGVHIAQISNIVRNKVWKEQA